RGGGPAARDPARATRDHGARHPQPAPGGPPGPRPLPGRRAPSPRPTGGRWGGGRGRDDEVRMPMRRIRAMMGAAPLGDGRTAGGRWMVGREGVGGLVGGALLALGGCCAPRECGIDPSTRPLGRKFVPFWESIVGLPGTIEREFETRDALLAADLTRYG